MNQYDLVEDVIRKKKRVHTISSAIGSRLMEKKILTDLY